MSVPMSQADYGSLFAWKIISDHVGRTPTHNDVREIGKRMLDRVKVSIDRDTFRRMGLTGEWMGSRLSDLIPVLNEDGR